MESYDWFIENYEESKKTKNASPHRKPVKEGILWLLKFFS